MEDNNFEESIDPGQGQEAEDLSPEIQKYSEMLSQDSGSRVFALLAEAYRKSSQYEEAVTTAREGLKHHPHYLSGRMALARALFDNGSINEAREEFEKVITAAPDNLMAHRHLADIYHQRGDLSQAAKSLKMVVLLDPNDHQSRQRLETMTTGSEAPEEPVEGGIVIQGHRYEETAPDAPPAAVEEQTLQEQVAAEFEPITDQEMIRDPDLGSDVGIEEFQPPPEEEEQAAEPPGEEDTADREMIQVTEPAEDLGIEEFQLSPEEEEQPAEPPGEEEGTFDREIIREPEPAEDPGIEEFQPSPEEEEQAAEPPGEEDTFDREMIQEPDLAEDPGIEEFQLSPEEEEQAAEPPGEDPTIAEIPGDGEPAFQEAPWISTLSPGEPGGMIETGEPGPAPEDEDVPETGAVWPSPESEEAPAAEDAGASPGEPVREEHDTETMAEILIQQGSYGEALSIYEKILASQPDDQRIMQKCEELRSLIQFSGRAAGDEAPEAEAVAVGESREEGAGEPSPLSSHEAEALRTLRQWLDSLKKEQE